MPDVKIIYCVPCGHLPRAEAMKKALEKEGATVELIGGDKGIHDVYINGKLVFSRHKEGRFPSNEEIIEKIK